jgi:hypothetical protein
MISAPIDGKSFFAALLPALEYYNLLRAGMKRENVQWLRSDAFKEAVDIHFRIDPKDVQDAYMASIPQLGI